MFLKELLLLPVCLTVNTQLSGVVISVADGDTFSIILDKEKFKIRLRGIDCPERSQAYGQKARDYTSEKIFGKEVTIITHGKDQYGRVIGGSNP
ncbi:MAG: thermonuclease family protein [Chitinispirillaceae bacterium]|nr:thermonuclease family protein [Chitinispirillaceae bacterium]